MSKKIEHIIALFWLCICFGNNSYCQVKTVNKGLFHQYSNFLIDSFRLNRLWFNDNAIIYELKTDFEYGENDAVVYRGYDVFKYSYFDICTKTFYDYNSFTDTATLICKYLSEENYTPPGLSFTGKNYHSLDSLIKMNDTLIGNKNFKRVKYIERRPDFNYVYEMIYYFACTGYKSDVVNINKAIENYFPNCFIQQVDGITSDKEQITRVTDRYEIVRPYLTAEEEKIFAIWAKNVKNNNLSLSTVAEMWKIPVVPIKFRDKLEYPMYH